MRFWTRDRQSKGFGEERHHLHEALPAVLLTEDVIRSFNDGSQLIGVVPPQEGGVIEALEETREFVCVPLH